MVREGMRGDDEQQNHVYLPPGMHVHKDDPLRAIRIMVDEVLRQFAWQERKNMRKVLILLLLCSTLCFARSRAAKHTFEIETGYPRGRPGYVVEYRVPLACGGADAPTTCNGRRLQTAKHKPNENEKDVGNRHDKQKRNAQKALRGFWFGQKNATNS
jgi:hypothetical protein